MATAATPGHPHPRRKTAAGWRLNRRDELRCCVPRCRAIGPVPQWASAGPAEALSGNHRMAVEALRLSFLRSALPEPGSDPDQHRSTQSEPRSQSQEVGHDVPQGHKVESLSDGLQEERKYDGGEDPPAE